VYTGPAGDTTSNSPFLLTITDVTSGVTSGPISQKLTSAQRSSAEWIEEAPSSNSGGLPLANFGSVAFSGASASVGSYNGSISAFPNASINMITRFGQLLDTTSNLTSSGDGFTVTTTGSSTSTSGGGHHRHGLPTIIGNGQTTVVNVPPVPTAAMATT